MGVLDRKAKPEQRAVVASAHRIKLTDSKQAERLKKRLEKWQERMWTYYDEVGEFGDIVDFIAESIARVRLYVAQITDQSDEKTEVTEGPPVVVLDSLKGPMGGHADMLREITVNLSLAGECFLVGLDQGSHEELDEDEWGIFSLEEIAYKDGKFKLKRDDGSTLVINEENDFILRIWLPHPRKSNDAKSPMRRVSGACEELLDLERLRRLIDRSRIASNGILVIPEEITTQEDGDSDSEEEDPFIKELTDAMETAIQDEDSASALVPVLLRVPGQYAEQVQHIMLDRKTEKEELERRTNLAIKRLGQGVPVPPENITGYAAANHWSGWLVDDQTFRRIEPFIQAICDSLTVGYLRPALGDESRFVVWYDAADLVVNPDRGSDADDAYDRGTISDETYREAKGFTEDDAPDDEELARRARWNSGQPPGGETTEGGPPAEPDEPPEEEEELTASAKPKNPGDRLVEIDRHLKAQLEVLCDSAMDRALERAGARLQSRVQKSSEVKQLTARVPKTDIVRAYGKAVVAALETTEDELLEGSFAEIEARYRRHVAEAQSKALAHIPNLSARERERIERRQEEDRDESWLWLTTALLAVARQRLYDPSPEAELGEVGQSSVPFNVIRESVARAGGARNVENVNGALVIGDRPVGGIGTGEVVTDLMTARGFAVSAFEWVYGVYQRSSFPPHEDLEGVAFQNFDDPALVNTESWPDTSHFMPGDHGGCRCDFRHVWVKVQEIEEAA